MAPFILPLLDIGGKLIEKLFPDPEQRAKAQQELLALQQQGELKDLEIRMSAIVTEAQSPDPWTSRARPSFMYVMYVVILSAIPMGFLTAWHPAFAKVVTDGYKDWLAAIPGDMWTLFGIGYIGYAGGRTFEKVRGVTK